MSKLKISNEARTLLAEIAPVILLQLTKKGDLLTFNDKHDIVAEHIQRALDRRDANHLPLEEPIKLEPQVGPGDFRAG